MLIGCVKIACAFLCFLLYICTLNVIHSRFFLKRVIKNQPFFLSPSPVLEDMKPSDDDQNDYLSDQRYSDLYYGVPSTLCKLYFMFAFVKLA